MSDSNPRTIRVIAIHVIHFRQGVPPAMPGTEVEILEDELPSLLKTGAVVRLGDPVPMHIRDRRVVVPMDGMEQERLRRIADEFPDVAKPIQYESQAVQPADQSAITRFFAQRRS